MNNIVVIGSCNIDLTVLSDKRPVAGETVLGNGLNIAPGGKGANQAVAAAKLGANVTMVGCIGNDACHAEDDRVASGRWRAQRAGAYRAGHDGCLCSLCPWPAAAGRHRRCSGRRLLPGVGGVR